MNSSYRSWPQLLAVPLKAVELARAPLALDHEPHRVGAALRRMRHARRQQQDLAFADRHIDAVPVLHGLEQNVALELVEEFLGRIDVIVGARVRAADHHDDEFAVTENALVADRRLQERAVLLDPALQIKRCRDGMACVPGSDRRMVRKSRQRRVMARIRSSLAAGGFIGVGSSRLQHPRRVHCPGGMAASARPRP